MNVKITIDAPELSSAINNLAVALSGAHPFAGVQLPVTEEPKQVETKKETPKPKDEPKTEKPEAKDPEPGTKPETEQEEPKNDSGISLDVLTTKTREFIQADKSNRAELKTFLDGKGVKKVTELKSSDYEEYLLFLESFGG